MRGWCRFSFTQLSCCGPAQDTWLGRVLNNFRYFEVSHMIMFVVLYAVLLVHPVPGLPRDHGNGRSVTWVRRCPLWPSPSSPS